MTTNKEPVKKIRAPRGGSLNTSSWQLEAPLRMLMNNLDSEVAENPEELIVYGGIGKAARNWPAYHCIVDTLQHMTTKQTLLIQSGKPVGVFETHSLAPRVLIANSNIVPKWANWSQFNALDKQGLMMYGQMTAGSWIYIGSQGIVQGTYETFNAAAMKHFSGSLQGKWILTAGLGGMGGAQPLAATMAGACTIVVECNRKRVEKRLETGYLDKVVDNLDDALSLLQLAQRDQQPVSIGLLGNACTIYQAIVERGILPDIVTDQTSAHDPLNGYLPEGWTLEEYDDKRRTKSTEVIKAAKKSMAKQVRAMLMLKARGAIVFDYGNNLRQVALDEGVSQAFDYPGFVPEYIRPLFCRGVGPFRWAALSGDPDDIYITDRVVKETFPDKPQLHHWLDMARQRIQFQGLPARICWLGLGERHKLGLAFNALVKSGELSAPLVVGRDHLDSGSVASPNRETESMLDGSDTVSDWPLLNALLNTCNGATWVSIHHGGGVGMGYSQHAGFVLLIDGTEECEARIKRVLFNDPATGVMRHADAGYDIATQSAAENQLWLPSID